MKEPFSLTRDGQTVRTMSKIAMIRTILLNHSYHHRGQLSVYLRLLDVPVPQSPVITRLAVPPPAPEPLTPRR